MSDAYRALLTFPILQASTKCVRAVYEVPYDHVRTFIRRWILQPTKDVLRSISYLLVPLPTKIIQIIVQPLIIGRLCEPPY